jgi:hypothetical protein
MEFLLPQIDVIQRAYHNAYSLDNWAVGRGAAKLKMIDHSMYTDKCDMSKTKTFLKKENNIVTFQLRGELGAYPKKARGIQGTVNEKTAYMLASQQEAICRALGGREITVPITFSGIEFRLFFASKMSSDDIAEFMEEAELARSSYPDSLYDERDGSNWDSNVQVSHREAIIGLYSLLNEELAAQTAKGVSIRGRVRCPQGTISYEVDGTVKSGHWDTSAGNGGLNVETVAQAAKALYSLGLRELRGLVHGDDYLGCLYFDRAVSPIQVARRLQQAESNLGIVPKRSLFREIEHVSFISLTFYRGIDNRFAALPKMGKIFGKLFWTTTPLRGRDPRALASACAQTFYPLYKSYPPMRAFLAHHMQEPPIGTYADSHYAERLPNRLRTQVDWEQQNLIKYGFSTCTLAVIVMFFNGLGSQSAGLIQHDCVTAMIQVDSNDPADRPGALVTNEDLTEVV